jgi:quercetin dioxygenase-like cupin family protein
MKWHNKLAAVAVLTVVTVLFIAVTPKKVVVKDMVVPSQQLKFEPTPQPGISRAVLWGDPAKGAYGAITRFTKGTKVDWHTHPHDIKAVVISGTLLYNNGSGEQRLGPGSFIQERSTIKHTTAAAPDSDATIFEEGAGPFAVTMVK